MRGPPALVPARIHALLLRRSSAGSLLESARDIVFSLNKTNIIREDLDLFFLSQEVGQLALSVFVPFFSALDKIV